ncbi:Na+ dependent nucleoside transporter NupC [hydrothermal vent metagenome]|uniref:Na+ dependent nucleoside transporter NupC n=1 Tax=hydrothermal vent metagenome TaxID=652676 RepID=A0A3B1CK38_9ZZZZ
MMILQSVFGLACLVGIAWAFSENKKAVDTKTIAVGLGLQFALAVALLKVPLFRDAFLYLNKMVAAIESATAAGTSFVFGYLGGAPAPFEVTNPGATFLFAFRGLPLIVVVSALSSLLFYWRILPIMVKAFSWLLRKTMDLGGAVGLGAAANIFVGMVESPLFIRPYIKNLTRSELFMIMTCGMATVAGTVMVLYASVLSSAIPGAMGHILTASIISAPAAITVAALMIPETQDATAGELAPVERASGSMDAITNGTIQGLRLFLNVVAMLVVLIALVSLANQILGLLPDFGGAPVTLERMLGYVMAPIVWMMGVPPGEVLTAGSLMGVKTVLNEFLAYLQLAALPEEALSERSRMIMTYAMCGFANFGSLGIMIGGMGAMAPERRDEIVSLGLKSIVAGTLATCMTGAIVGILI